ncbi:hypothetical protein DDB_G0275039 [Dictyostelium discoideum AX4]|uniref:Transmembrane protein n=1 Tax=Dictyostelium discoideum TaxID=44689 RepID=Q86I62_DICDI|nr:hypothetical protein DDB_G0275039 [Dictyostelium discoideum AX4]EAL69800.1 hypothetical protein DDB_G0275039 [Dictyostelium discoideum AX4]|eukprot:XP_643845.1 hypothetical protein DDB_G0275039 [Dictyostelium discoideum AX4]
MSTTPINNKGKNYGGGYNKQYLILLLADGILAFVNWSLMVEFISVIWFFPMGFMGFTGWEAALLAIFTPIFLGIGFINRIVSRFNLPIRLVAQLLAFFAIFPWAIDKASIKNDEFGIFSSPHVTKTFFVSVAVALDWLAQCNSFANVKSAVRRERGAYAYALAIVLHAIIRLPYLSINPFMTWSNWIVFGMILVLVAFVILMGENINASDEKKSGAIWSIEHETSSSSTIATGVSFGGIIFFNQLLFSTYGLIPRWVGLNPFPYGLFVILGMMAGVVISKKKHLVTSRNFFIFALILSAIFGWCSGTVPFIVGFIGLISASLLGAYCNSLWIVLIEKVSNTEKLGQLFTSAMLTYTVLLFWAIYVVSYKFVPWWLGSTLLRERNQTLIIACVLATGIAFVYKSLRSSGGSSSSSIKREKSNKDQPSYPNKDVFNILFGLLVLLLLFSVNRAITHPTDSSIAGHHYTRDLTATSVTNTAPTDIKSMIWTIHFGYDNFGRNSFPNVTKVIKDHGANIIGLLESDLSRVMTSNRDLVEWIATELHMYSDFGPEPSRNTWGCALLTIFPIISSDRVILPSPEGELACLIDAVLLIDETPVNVIVTHFGNTEDVLDRKLQTEGAAAIVKKNADMPIIFLSYITTKVNTENYNTLRASGLDDTTNEGRYCQYIFYKNLQLNKFQRFSSFDISDTEQQVASFSVIKENKQQQQQTEQQTQQ